MLSLYGGFLFLSTFPYFFFFFLGSFGEILPVRHSPRISRYSSKHNEQLETDITKDSSVSNEDKEESRLNLTKQDIELSESSSSQTESSIKQSPRLLQKVKGRKSLSRQVLEHNAFSRVLSSPSITDPVSKETSFTKVEKSVVMKKTQDTLEVTTKETKEEITNVSDLSNTSVSSHHSERSSTCKEIITEGYTDADTSVETDFCLNSPDLPKSLKMSDSLVEYIKRRTNKFDTEEMSTKNNKTQLEEPETAENLKDLQSESQKDNLPKEDDKFESEPVDVYEDLSSGAEDIKEVLMENKLPNDQCEVNIELSNCSQLEKNIFEISEIMQQTVENETG